MAKIFDIDRDADIITLGNTITKVIVPRVTATHLVSSNASKELIATDLASWVTGTANQISIADDGDGTVTLSTPQDIHAGANPTFVALNLVADAASILFNWTADTSYGELQFKEGGTHIGAFGGYGTNYIPASVAGNLVLTSILNNDGGILFRTKTGGSLDTKMTIMNNGSVGIGTITPDTTLQVVGTAGFGDDAGNETLFSATGVLSFAGTARIDWTKITANGVTLADGPPTSGDTVSDLQTAHDGNTYEVAEIAANAGQNLVVDFAGVTAFNWVQILARVAETAGHALTVQLEITPFNGSAWHTYHAMKDQPADQNFENYSFFVPSDTAYINGGVVKVRFVHEMAGNANDDWFFDVVALYR